MKSRAAGFAAQAYHYVEANDFVSIRRHGGFIDDNIGKENVHKLVLILDVEVTMLGIVGSK